jgi:TPR repeat protein
MYWLAALIVVSGAAAARWVGSHEPKREAEIADNLLPRAMAAQLGRPCFRAADCASLTCVVMHVEDDEPTLSELLDRPEGDHVCSWKCRASADCLGAGACNDRGYCEPPGMRLERTLKPLQVLCDEGRDRRGSACYAVAESYWTGSALPRDPARGVSYYEKSCAQGEDAACEALRDAYRDGDPIPKDESRRALFQAKLCALDPGDESCPPRSCKAAADCDGGICNDAGHCEAPVAPFDARANDKCTREGSAEACLGLAHDAAARGKPEVALYYLGEGCRTDDATACEEESRALGLAAPPEPARAAWYHRKACALGLAGCSDAAAP